MTVFEYYVKNVMFMCFFQDNLVTLRATGISFEEILIAAELEASAPEAILRQYCDFRGIGQVATVLSCPEVI